ncbi:MAG: endonuclease III [Lentimicrobiaceae bacterium]|jgi:endonuclease-3|nr:endonuclease III [Lentimicrobiaceae bacterium]
MKKLSKSEHFKNILQYFEKNMPVAETELQYKNPYQLLVATILSAQCTDKRVNMITPFFFQHLPNALALSKAQPEFVFNLVKSCSYPNNKTKNLIGMAQALVDKFNSEVPSDITLLQTLPGVGRKTANVIASVIFNKPVLAVDTHVFRVSARLGLTTGAKNPLQTEKQLVKYIPDHLIPIAHHWLILHGRYVCMARKPKCGECGLKNYCHFYQNGIKNEILL